MDLLQTIYLSAALSQPDSILHQSSLSGFLKHSSESKMLGNGVNVPKRNTRFIDFLVRFTHRTRDLTVDEKGEAINHLFSSAGPPFLLFGTFGAVNYGWQY
ncbi:hypothetical protein AVEN_103480-1 [Araneus ventricosus]|uniref:Uncharacterized protein n=1 Tax=Araneus ventricosus TaxID=182803 RepID=A0A4Y2J098_ARAVE|nr:hypothetical protein AVEN_103480-1 [Araneus ventricosus]